MFELNKNLIVIILSLLLSSIAFAGNEISTRPKIDFLFVIDNSGSMNSSQGHLAAQIPQFLKNLLRKNIDFHAAVTTTDAYLSKFQNDLLLSQLKDGNLIDGPTGVRVVINETHQASEILRKNLRQGVSGSGDERVFSSFRAALENSLNFEFRRIDAHLAVIILSDEDDATHDSANFIEDLTSLAPISETVDFLDQFTKSTPFYKLYTVSAIAIFDGGCMKSLSNSSQKIGARYSQLVDLSNGAKVSLCSNFGTGLDEIVESTLRNMNH